MNILKIFNNKKVIITGHTGFKGSWLTLWLQNLGANIMGVSKDIVTTPSHFEVLKLNKKIINKMVDINDLKQIKKIINQFKPAFIFHLAAQALVRKSYADPVDTVKTNTIGTLNILEAARYLKNDCNVILITSDKVYKNLEINRGYNEKDILGGKDPYSGSKLLLKISFIVTLTLILIKKTKPQSVLREQEMSLVEEIGQRIELFQIA